MKYPLVSGNVALDFVGTLKWRTTTPVELLATPDALDSWLVQSEILSTSPRASARDLEEALALREAVYELAHAKITGREWDRRSVKAVNAMAAAPHPTATLTPQGLTLTGPASSAMAVIAREAAVLMSGSDWSLVKECGRPQCTRIFVDRSRGRRRTWCGMDECGNRIKAANYRARNRNSR